MTIAVDVQVFAQCHQHLLTLGEMLKQPTTQKLILFIGEKVNVCVCAVLQRTSARATQQVHTNLVTACSLPMAASAALLPATTIIMAMVARAELSVLL